MSGNFWTTQFVVLLITWLYDSFALLNHCCGSQGCLSLGRYMCFSKLFQDSFEEFYDEKNLKKRSIDQQFYLPERKAKVNQIVKTIEHCDAPDTVYCICRSTDGTRFMIACDNCEEWYHGDCIGISEKDATFIKQYYCNTCKGRDQSLVTKYKHKKHRDKTEKKLLKTLPPETLDKSATEYKGKLRENETAEDLRKKSSRRCGGCHACYRTEDCGRCDFCKDMKKYGGPNRIRQKCRLRQCSNFGIVTGKAASELEDRLSSKKSDFNDSSFYDYLKDESQENLERQERLERQEKKRKKKLSSKNDKNDKGSPRKKQKDKKSPTKKKHSQKSKDRKSEFRFEVEDVKQEPVEDVPKQCLGPGCVEHARTGSKYCSDECGMKLAKSRIYELLPPKIQQWQSSPCVAEEKNKRMLEKIRREQQETRQKLVDLDQRHQELDAIVEKAKQIKAESDNEQVAESEDESEYVMFCVTCGLEINQKVALRHMEKCFAKFEAQTSFGSIYKTRIEGNSMFCDFYNPQQKTYCKRLKVLCPEHTKEIRVTSEEVCGSPLVSNVFEESEDDLCRIPKRKCSKHYCWEKCRRAQIDLERVRQWMKIDDLFEQERNIRHTISNRMGVLGLMLHQAVDHNPLNPIIVPDMD